MTDNLTPLRPAVDFSMALLEQAGLAAYERDPLGQSFLLWLTKPSAFAGGSLPQAATTEQNYLGLVHEEDRARVTTAFTHALKNDGVYRLDYRLSLGNDATAPVYAWVQDAGRIEYAASGLPLKSRGVITHLEPYVTRAEAAEFSSQHDPLTGRPNRQKFQTHVDAAITAGGHGSVVIVSIDNMTWLNEAIGAEDANGLLMAATQRLDRLLPKDNCETDPALCPLIARTGGDSFGIWLPGVEGRPLDKLVKEILKSFREQHFATPENALHVTVSIGTVAVPHSADTGIEAITRAEQALKSGRLVGRNANRAYEASEDRRAAHLTSLGDLDRVQKAISSDSLVLAFQPIVDSGAGSDGANPVAFYEALLRMRLPNGEITSVFSFIQALELHGLAQDIDRHVLGLAIAKMEAMPELRLSVNISGATASDAAFQQFLSAQLGHRRHVAERMILEITETAAINDLKETARFVSLSHALGAKVALDDFGEGFTALQHLRTLEVDYIKIDGGLIRDITTNAQHQVMVKAILSMAQHMGVQTVAEFVETEREAAWLQRHGANFLQGYYFGRAEIELPADVGQLTDTTAKDFLANSGILTLSI